MLQLLALLPTIFSTIGKVSDMFDSGKEQVEKVTGKPSEASTPEELQDEIHALPQAQQVQWAQVMSQKIELYKEQNNRLDIEIGRITPELTAKLTPEAANKIAIQRQTTRPWIVRKMAHFTMIPAYLIALDVVQGIVATWFVGPATGEPFQTYLAFNSVFGVYETGGGIVDTMSSILGQPKTLFAKMYVEALPWTSGIIVSYMGLREIGKVKGQTDHPNSPNDNGASMGMGAMVSSVGGAISTSLGLVGKVRGLFK